MVPPWCSTPPNLTPSAPAAEASMMPWPRTRHVAACSRQHSTAPMKSPTIAKLNAVSRTRTPAVIEQRRQTIGNRPGRPQHGKPRHHAEYMAVRAHQTKLDRNARGFIGGKLMRRFAAPSAQHLARARQVAAAQRKHDIGIECLL